MSSFNDVNHYQQLAVSTAIYNKSKQRVLYPLLGLSGESGEVCKKIKKIYRDNNGEINEEQKLGLIKELGDCLWYYANLGNDLNYELSELFSCGTFDEIDENIDSYKDEYPIIGHTLAHSAFVGAIISSLAFEGEVNSVLFKEYVKSSILELAGIANVIGVKLKDVAQMNYEKLKSRQERGKLGGSGDLR